MRLQSWKVLRFLPALLAVGLLAGCSSPDPFQSLPSGGVSATTGPLVLDDVWVQGPQGLAAGANAPVRLVVVNESATTADSLVAVSTPAAQRTVLLTGGHTVSSVALPANSAIDLEWSNGIEVEGLRSSLRPGQQLPITFTFAKAAPVTLQVTVGPLGAPASTPTPTPTPSTPSTPTPTPTPTP
jgi:copper(I)-binding protein